MRAFAPFFLVLLTLATIAVVAISPATKKFLSAANELKVSTEAAAGTETTPAQQSESDFLAKVDAIKTGTETETGNTYSEAPEVVAPAAEPAVAATTTAPAASEGSGFWAETPAPAAPSAPVAAASKPAPAVPSAASTVAELARRPKEWPMNVYLTKAHQFPLVLNGRSIGSAEVPAGTRLKLIAIHTNETATVDFNGGRLTVPAADTDLARQLKPGSNRVEAPIISAQVTE
jgi:hypothetical protein